MEPLSALRKCSNSHCDTMQRPQDGPAAANSLISAAQSHAVHSHTAHHYPCASGAFAVATLPHTYVQLCKLQQSHASSHWRPRHVSMLNINKPRSRLKASCHKRSKGSTQHWIAIHRQQPQYATASLEAAPHSRSATQLDSRVACKALSVQK